MRSVPRKRVIRAQILHFSGPGLSWSVTFVDDTQQEGGPCPPTRKLLVKIQWAPESPRRAYLRPFGFVSPGQPLNSNRYSCISLPHSRIALVSLRDTIFPAWFSRNEEARPPRLAWLGWALVESSGLSNCLSLRSRARRASSLVGKARRLFF